MAKRVSAETITEITSSPGFAPPGAPLTPPSPEKLVDDIRQSLDARIEKFTRLLGGDLPEEDFRRATESLERARHHRDALDDMVREVPEGFKLVPVLYSKITQDQNAAVHDEYLSHVRTRFLKFIGEHHADAARAAGICETGIERMKLGLDPADAQGRPYDMNIDHIVERAGSGLWAIGKEKDPDQKAEVEDKFRQNHFGNLILIPTKIHEYKNTLNSLQRIGDLKPGESKWILMMTPERSDKHPAFVCPPQTPGSRWDVLGVKPRDAFNEIHHADFVVKQANDRLREFRASPVVDKGLQAVEEIARRYKRNAADMANDNIKGRRSLSAIFNDVIAHDEAAQENEKMLRPALKEAAENLSRIFDNLADNLGGPKGNALLQNFGGFYRSGSMRALREAAAKLPMAEAKQLTDICKAIDTDMDVLMPPRKRDNNNGPAPAPQGGKDGRKDGGGKARKNFNGKSGGKNQRKGRNDNSLSTPGEGWKKNKRKKKRNGSRTRDWRE